MALNHRSGFADHVIICVPCFNVCSVSCENLSFVENSSVLLAIKSSYVSLNQALFDCISLNLKNFEMKPVWNFTEADYWVNVPKRHFVDRQFCTIIQPLFSVISNLFCNFWWQSTIGKLRHVFQGPFATKILELIVKNKHIALSFSCRKLIQTFALKNPKKLKVQLFKKLLDS